MEQVVALLTIAYANGVLLGEALRDRPYDPTSDKWKLYSGLFVLLNHRCRLPSATMRQIISDVLQTFAVLVHCPVRTNVRISRQESSKARDTWGMKHEA